jgi:hypothetical protein
MVNHIRNSVNTAIRIAEYAYRFAENTNRRYQEAAAANPGGEKGMDDLMNRRTDLTKQDFAEVTDELKSELEKLGVGFHIEKNGEKDYTMFFEAKNAAVMESALEQSLKRMDSPGMARSDGRIRVAHRNPSLKDKAVEAGRRARAFNAKARVPKIKIPGKGRA